jgi:hypothetical protein
LFDGKEKNFSNWWARFKAYSRVQGFADGLVSTKPVVLKNKETDADHFNEKEYPDAVKVFKVNSLAVAN